MNNLQFNETLTVEQFKAKHNVTRLDIKRNPHTDKLFFSFGAQVGAVSSKGIPQKPMLSHVTTEEGDSFWMLHEEGTGGAPTIASL